MASTAITLSSQGGSCSKSVKGVKPPQYDTPHPFNINEGFMPFHFSSYAHLGNSKQYLGRVMDVLLLHSSATEMDLKGERAQNSRSSEVSGGSLLRHVYFFLNQTNPVIAEENTLGHVYFFLEQQQERSDISAPINGQHKNQPIGVEIIEPNWNRGPIELKERQPELDLTPSLAGETFVSSSRVVRESLIQAIEEIICPALAVALLGKRTFRSFCSACAIDAGLSDAPISCQDAIRGLIGNTNTKQLIDGACIPTQVIDLPVQLDSSNIDLLSNGPFILVSSAVLKLQVPGGAAIQDGFYALSIVSAEVRLDCSANGIISARFSATTTDGDDMTWLRTSPNSTRVVNFMVGSNRIPASMHPSGKRTLIELNDLDSVSVIALARSLSLHVDSMAKLPVVGKLLDLRLAFATLEFDNLMDTSAPASLQSACLVLQIEKLSIGIFDLSDLEISIIHHGADGFNSDTEDHWTFSVRASQEELLLQTEIFYNTREDILKINLRPRTPISVVKLLNLLSPGFLRDKQLHALEGFEVSTAEAVISTQDWSIKHCKGAMVLPGGITARFLVDMDSPTSSMFTAEIEPGSKGGTLEVQSLSALVGPNVEWISSIPKHLQTRRFNSASVRLFVNLSKQSFTVCGSITGIGDAVLIAKPDSIRGGYGYLFSLAANNLRDIWPVQMNDVSSSFNLTSLAVHVVAADTTIEQLKGDLQELEATGMSKAQSTQIVERIAGCTSLPPETTLSRGTWLFAAINLYGTSKMTKALELGLDLRSKPTVTLYAQMPSDGDGTEYTIDLRNFTFMGGKITLNGRGSYIPAENLLTVDAVLSLVGLTDEPIDFDAQVEFREGETKFNLRKPDIPTLPLQDVCLPSITVPELKPLRRDNESLRCSLDFPSYDTWKPDPITLSSAALKSLELKSPDLTSSELKSPELKLAKPNLPKNNSISIKNIFKGKMFDIELVAPSFHGSIIELAGNITQSHILTAGVKFRKGDIDPSLLASILFLEGKPQVVAINFSSPLSIPDLLQRVFMLDTNKCLNWPDTYPVLTLEKTNFYYSADIDAITVEGIQYQPGYHAIAQLKFFNRTFDISVDLPENMQGFAIAGTYNGSIDLGFARINMPKVHINTTNNQKVFALSASLTLCGIEGLDLSLDYQPGKLDLSNNFAGKASYSGQIFGIKNPEFPFNFRNGSFSLSNWALARDGDGIIDLAEAICKASASDGSCCGEIKGMKFDGVKTKFNFSMSLDQNISGDGTGILDAFSPAIKATAHMSFDVLVASQKITSIQVGDIEIRVSAPFSKDRLWTTLALTIKENAVRIGKEMLSHPEELAKVIALQNVSKWSKQAVKGLTCRKVKPKNLTQQAEAHANEQPAKIDIPVPPIATAVGLATAVVPGIPGPSPTLVTVASVAAVSIAGGAAVSAVSASTSILSSMLSAPLAVAALPFGSKKKRKEEKEKSKLKKAAIEASSHDKDKEGAVKDTPVDNIVRKEVADKDHQSSENKVAIKKRASADTDKQEAKSRTEEPNSVNDAEEQLAEPENGESRKSDANSTSIDGSSAPTEDTSTSIGDTSMLDEDLFAVAKDTSTLVKNPSGLSKDISVEIEECNEPTEDTTLTTSIGYPSMAARAETPSPRYATSQFVELIQPVPDEIIAIPNKVEDEAKPATVVVTVDELKPAEPKDPQMIKRTSLRPKKSMREIFRRAVSFNSLKHSNMSAPAIIPVSTAVPILRNGSFSSESMQGWQLDAGGNEVRIVKHGLRGDRHKLISTVLLSSVSGVWLRQHLTTEVGKRYRLSLKLRYDINDDQGYFNVFVDGEYIVTHQSSKVEGRVYALGGAFVAERPNALLEISMTSTWGTSMIFEVGGICVEPIG